MHFVSDTFAPFLVSRGGIMSPTPPSCISPIHMTSLLSQGSDVRAGLVTFTVWKMDACARISSTVSSITRLVELADPNCAIKTLSSVTWRASTSLQSHGEHLRPIATDGVPLWVMVVHCQPQATQKKWRSAELIVDNDGMGHDDDRRNVPSPKLQRRTVLDRLVRVSLMARQSQSTQDWKDSYWGSLRGKFGVNIKMNDFVGNILQYKFYACCYILQSGTRPKRRCRPICGAALGGTTAETSLLRWMHIALNSPHPIHAAQMGIILVIVVA